MSAPELKKHDNGVYYIHFIEGRRTKRVSTREKGEKPAQIFFANWMLVKNSQPATVAIDFKVKDLWQLYCEKHKVAAEATRAWAWKNLNEHFGELYPAEINDDTINDPKRGYVALRVAGKIGRPSKTSTIRRELAALVACFSWCADHKRKIISRDAIPQFDLPSACAPRDRWLTRDEIARLGAAAIETRERCAGSRATRLSRGERFIWLALETAARKGAILDLTWDRVDFETRMIDYDVPGRKKTKKRRAQVPISDTLLPVLKRAYDERINNFVMDNKSSVDLIIRRIAARAGVDGVTPHVFRHTAATNMARRGVPLWTIAGVLGNSMAVVESTYAKHCPKTLLAGVNAISGTLEAAE